MKSNGEKPIKPSSSHVSLVETDGAQLISFFVLMCACAVFFGISVSPSHLLSCGEGGRDGC